MKAAIVTAPGATPVYGDFQEPVARDGEVVVNVEASALSHLSKARSTGAHYSSDGTFPAVAGVDGVGTTADGRRLYFVLPLAPFGALAERCPVPLDRCVEVPGELDSVTAAALANPGMSAWAALVERAKLQPGETVLVNGATGTAGRIAVQVAKNLGAGKVIATARNASELEEIRALGADVLVPFDLGPHNPRGSNDLEQTLQDHFASGIDVVIDYLYGQSALSIITAIAKSAEDGRPVRFVHVGAAGGDGAIDLPGAALRSSAIVLMGSGLKSVPLSGLLDAIRNTFRIAVPANLQIATRTLPLSRIETAWNDALGKPRLVFTPGS